MGGVIKPDPPGGRLGAPVPLDSLMRTSGRLGAPVSLSSLASAPAQDATGVEPDDEEERRKKAIAAAMAEYDRTTGAPARVRVALSAAGSPEDQLATLRRTYPDAHIAPNGKLAFTNPATGKKTLVNDRWPAVGVLGFSAGDIAAAAPTVGGIAGGLAGAMAGGPAAPVTRVVGSGFGYAGGEALGEVIAKIGDRAVNDTPAQDTRSPRDVAVESLLDIPTGMAMEAGGMLIPKAVTAATRAIPAAVRGVRQGARVAENAVRVGRESGFADAVSAAARREGALPSTTLFGGAPDEVADAMMRRGMTRDGIFGEGPSASRGVLSPEGSVANRSGNALEQTFAGGPLAAAKQTAETQLDEGMRSLARSIEGTPPTPRAAAQASQRTQQAVLDKVERDNVALLQRAFDGTEGQQLVQPTRVQSLLQAMDDYVKEHPLAKSRYAPAQARLREIVEAAKGPERMVPDPMGIIDDATGQVRMVKSRGPEGVTVSDLRDTLSDLGTDIGEITKAGQSGSTIGQTKTLGQLRRSYAELSNEVETALGKPTPGITADDVLAGKGTARDAWDMQRSMIAESHDAANPVRQEAMKRMVSQGKLKQSLDFTLKADPIEQAARLRSLRGTADTKDWKILQSFAIDHLGRNANGQFTARRMVTQFNKMTPEARRTLFDPAQVKALEDYALIAERFAKNPLSARGSVNNALHTFNQIANIPLAGAGAAAGFQQGGMTGAIVGGALAPASLFAVENVAARFLSNPTLTRWLTTTYRMVDSSPKAWQTQLSRLLALKKVEPEMADVIDAYYAQATADQ